MSYQTAVERLRAVLVATRAGGDQEIGNIIRARDEVLSRFNRIFSLENVPLLTAEDFRNFLHFEQNRHWSGINRWGTILTARIDVLRDTLARLLDESVPIRERINSILGDNGQYRITGLGKAVVTPILLVGHPDDYGVWNEPAELGMRQLSIWPIETRGLSVGEKYERINSLLLRIARDLETDLWTVDALWWRIAALPNGAPMPPSRYSEEDYETALQTLEELESTGPLDERREVAVRVEQGFVRQALFEGKQVEKCVVCGREFPKDLLKAAHIKRRADCSLEEKRDYRNNVVPMCVFGCDELFERGYIVVRAGRVARGKKSGTTDAVESYLAMVTDRPCLAFYHGGREYFEWHAESHGC